MSPMNNRLLRPLANGFNPKSIAGLAAWWDSTDNSTITTDTGVSAWVDKVNGYTLGQSTGANQPTISSINGKQAFDYNGSSQFLNSTAAGLLAEATDPNGVNDTSVFVVLEFDGNSETQFGAAWSDVANFRYTYSSLMGFDSGNWGQVYRNVTTYTSAPQSFKDTGIAYAVATPYITATLVGANRLGRVNGSQVLNDANPDPSTVFNSGNFSVGANDRAGGTQGFLNGRIGDVLIYDRVLTLAEIQRVERWLAGKFGVTLA